MHFDHFIRAACAGRGLVWRKYRRASRKRVVDRITALGLRGYEDYLQYLKAHPEEAAELPNLLRVTVSRFFRDRTCWQELAEEVLPGLASKSLDKTLKLLCIGACGGEEPYSLALSWVERVQPLYPKTRVSITALDLDSASLARARKGRYQHRTLRETPQDIKVRRFSRENGWFRLDPEIMDMVEFKRLDVLKDPLPAGQDLILCRYLAFTYFQAELEMAMSIKLWQALKDEGVLMIGAKEGLGRQVEDLFQPLPGTGCFGRKKRPAQSPRGQ